MSEQLRPPDSVCILVPSGMLGAGFTPGAITRGITSCRRASATKCSRAGRRVSLPITLTGVSSPHSTGSAASAVLIIPEPTARQYSRRLSRSVVPG
jgi:hypothetical protein